MNNLEIATSSSIETIRFTSLEVCSRISFWKPWKQPVKTCCLTTTCLRSLWATNIDRDGVCNSRIRNSHDAKESDLCESGEIYKYFNLASANPFKGSDQRTRMSREEDSYSCLSESDTPIWKIHSDCCVKTTTITTEKGELEIGLFSRDETRRDEEIRIEIGWASSRDWHDFWEKILQAYCQEVGLNRVWSDRAFPRVET